VKFEFATYELTQHVSATLTQSGKDC
jgi:hypothetical protein